VVGGVVVVGVVVVCNGGVQWWCAMVCAGLFLGVLTDSVLFLFIVFCFGFGVGFCVATMLDMC